MPCQPIDETQIRVCRKSISFLEGDEMMMVLLCFLRISPKMIFFFLVIYVYIVSGSVRAPIFILRYKADKI